ncbi:MAG: sugar ABC transporter substrate-binding protein, partial [Pseudomonas sp.]
MSIFPGIDSVHRKRPTTCRIKTRRYSSMNAIHRLALSVSLALPLLA